jgi:hypothetical protein
MSGRFSTTPEAWAARRAEVGEAAAQAIQARAVLAPCCYEPRCLHECPLCTGYAHPRCVFAAGSLFCVTPDCGNPHHRAAPARGGN